MNDLLRHQFEHKNALLLEKNIQIKHQQATSATTDEPQPIDKPKTRNLREQVLLSSGQLLIDWGTTLKCRVASQATS